MALIQLVRQIFHGPAGADVQINRNVSPLPTEMPQEFFDNAVYAGPDVAGPPAVLVNQAFALFAPYKGYALSVIEQGGTTLASWSIRLVVGDGNGETTVITHTQADNGKILFPADAIPRPGTVVSVYIDSLTLNGAAGIVISNTQSTF